MANCHFELSRDCELGWSSELLLADVHRLSVLAFGGGVLVSNNCFIQQNTTASLLELYFNDPMQTVYARAGGGGSEQREVADGADAADVVFTLDALRRLRCYIVYLQKMLICG